MYGDHVNQMVTFIDNHDRNRFLTEAGGDIYKMKNATTYWGQSVYLSGDCEALGNPATITATRFLQKVEIIQFTGIDDLRFYCYYIPVSCIEIYARQERKRNEHTDFWYEEM